MQTLMSQSKRHGDSRVGWVVEGWEWQGWMEIGSVNRTIIKPKNTDGHYTG